MIIDKKMIFIQSIDGFDYYLFKPSIFRLYYEKRNDDAPHRFTMAHRLHMLIYLLMGGLTILYLAKNNEVVSYIVFTKCNKWIVKGANQNSLFTIFLYTYPQHRNKSYASKITAFYLNCVGLNYFSVYKTILPTNVGSIRVAERNGFVMTEKCFKKGIMHRVVSNKNGNWLFYSYEK